MYIRGKPRAGGGISETARLLASTHGVDGLVVVATWPRVGAGRGEIGWDGQLLLSVEVLLGRWTRSFDRTQACVADVLLWAGGNAGRLVAAVYKHTSGLGVKE